MSQGLYRDRTFHHLSLFCLGWSKVTHAHEMNILVHHSWLEEWGCNHCRFTVKGIHYTAPNIVSVSSMYRSPQTLWICNHNCHGGSVDEPVEMIDRLSLSIRWYIAYIVATILDPYSSGIVLYQDTVSHCSRVLSRSSNTKPWSKQTKNRWKPDGNLHHNLSSAQITTLLFMPLEASIIDPCLNSVVHCAVGFDYLQF